MNRDDVIQLALDKGLSDAVASIMADIVQTAERGGAVAERARCCAILERLHDHAAGAHNHYQFAAELLRGRGAE